MSQKASSSVSKEYIIPIKMENDDNHETLSEKCTEDTHFQDDDTTPDSLEDFNESHTTLDNIEKHTLPSFNCQEKIIIVVDSCEDENATSFQLENTTHNTLYMLKRAIWTFIRTKSMINKKHEFAVVVLNSNSTKWLLNFTSDIRIIEDAIDNIQASDAEDIFQLESLFNLILEQITVPELTEIEGLIVPPPYIVRTVLFYNRSYTLPQLATNPAIRNLLKADFFFLDILMSHEPTDINNNTAKISQILQNLDTKGLMYFFSVERNAKLLIESASKLAAHPLQRPIQKLANYNIKVDGEE